MKRNAFSRPAQPRPGAWHVKAAQEPKLKLEQLKCPTDTHDMLIKRPQTADGDRRTDSGNDREREKWRERERERGSRDIAFAQSILF